MAEGTNIVDFNYFIDAELANDFEQVCADNGVTAKFVLGAFVRDYIVSGGHPEHVTGSMPWNRKSKTASYSYNPFCS